MSKLTTILLIAGAGLAAWYVPTLLAIYNLDMSIISVMPTAITDKTFTSLITVKLTNKSSTILNISYIAADIYLNGLKIAQLDQVETMVLMGNSEQNFNISITVDPDVIAQETLKQLLASNLQNSVLNIKGLLTANNKKIPFDKYKTITDFKI